MTQAIDHKARLEALACTALSLGRDLKRLDHRIKDRDAAARVERAADQLLAAAQSYLDDDTAQAVLPPDTYRRLRELGIAPIAMLGYPVDLVDLALEKLEALKARGPVPSPGHYVMKTVVELVRTRAGEA